MNEPRMTRRDVLRWLSAAAAAGYAMQGCAFGEDKNDKDAHPPKLVNLAALASESAKAIDDPKVIVVRTAKGIAAFPRICTHKHQELDVDNDGGIVCTLHGSRFGLDGKPTGGPANRALKWYRVEVDKDGAIRVDVKHNVDEGTWADVPDWAKPKSK